MATIKSQNRPPSEPERRRNRPQAGAPKPSDASPPATPSRRKPARAPAPQTEGTPRRRQAPEDASRADARRSEITRAPDAPTQPGPPLAMQADASFDTGVRPAPELGNSATVSAQLWLQDSPWRVTGGWSVLAALVAYGLLARSFFVDWRLVALALLLADPLWGSIWRLAGGRTALLPLRRQTQASPFWLPYLRPGSPAAQLLGWDQAYATPDGSPRDPSAEQHHSAAGLHNVVPLVFRVALPTLVLPLAIGWVLGVQALWLTVGVIVVSVLGWLGRHFLAEPPGIFQSLVTVTLPWVLMLGLLNMPGDHELFALHAALILLWTIHHWGQVRVSRVDWSAGPGSDRLGIGLLAFADLGMGALLIVAQTPLWLAPLAILWLPTYLTLYQGKRVQRLAFWWLAALLLSSAAIGSRMF
ncbi:MAG: hypothetical protein WDZ49_13510 [Litorilinea sp.]